jgi:hypothetical protein
MGAVKAASRAGGRAGDEMLVDVRDLGGVQLAGDRRELKPQAATGSARAEVGPGAQKSPSAPSSSSVVRPPASAPVRVASSRLAADACNRCSACTRARRSEPEPGRARALLHLLSGAVRLRARPALERARSGAGRCAYRP